MDILRSLDLTTIGYRPKQSLIDLFEEGGLEYLHLFAHHQAVGAGNVKYSLHAVELYHVRKDGNRIRQLAADRVLPYASILFDYEQARENLRNPYYKRIYLRNLLRSKPWYSGAEEIFQTEVSALFVSSQKTPRDVPFFGLDVRAKFAKIQKSIKLKGVAQMSPSEGTDQSDLRIYQLVQNYLRRRTEEKSGKKYEEFCNNKDQNGKILFPKEYREALEKVSMDAFLAMRSRRDQDFVEYFTGTICSVPQFLPEREFAVVATKLIKDWQTIKTLSMLAISAISYLGKSEQEEHE